MLVNRVSRYETGPGEADGGCRRHDAVPRPVEDGERHVQACPAESVGVAGTNCDTIVASFVNTSSGGPSDPCSETTDSTDRPTTLGSHLPVFVNEFTARLPGSRQTPSDRDGDAEQRARRPATRLTYSETETILGT
ncbi:MAG: hypothetical protein A07HB70_01225 [uncultured archaeon A07HB70]|nr:MAG: hypothetical protein A07HB70_01225 [uncultured archaeon A07HB70]